MLAIGAIVSIVVTAIGVADLPAWAVVASSAGLTLTAAALAHSLAGPAEHRVPALWTAVTFLAMTLAGSWIYVAASDGGAPPANFVADKFVTFSLEPGSPADDRYDAKGLRVGAINTAHCYVTVEDEIWLDFGDGWLPRSDVRPARGYPERLPPRCS